MRRERSAIMSRDTRFAYLINIPLIIYLVCMLAWPICWGFYTSLTNKTIGGGNGAFVGLKNYINLLMDPSYRSSIVNTLVFTAISISLKLVLGLAMALALNTKFRGRNIVRALLLIPWTLPNIVAVLNWRWIFSSTGGIANYILTTLGIADHDLVWFGSPKLAMATVIIANVWRGTPFFAISILASLQTISADGYEAASIDGANIFQQFWHITLPEIRDTILLSTLMSTIWTLNEFESVWLMTGGGPNGSPEVMNVFSYQTAMKSMMLGKGIAVSILAMPVLIALITVLARHMVPKDGRR